MQDVAADRDPAGAVVQIDRHDLGKAFHPLLGIDLALDVMKVVMADGGAAGGQVAAGVDGSGIAGFQADTGNVVELDQVVVADEVDADVRGLVNAVVGDALADAFHRYGGLIGANPPAVVMDVIVHGEVVAGRQRHAVASVEADAPLADVVNIAARNAAAGGRPAFANADGKGAQIAEGAAHDLNACAAGNGSTRCPAAFDGEAANCDERCVGERQQRRVQQGDPGVALLHRAWRPEVEQPALAVEIPFPRLIEFFEQVERIKTFTGSISMHAMRCFGDYQALFQVDGVHLLVAVGPWKRPVTMEPEIRGLRPAFGPITFVGELPAVLAGWRGRDARPAMVGPACQGHGLVSKKQFQAAAIHRQGGAATA